MRRQQRITVDLAVQILRSASSRSGEEPIDTVPVRLALPCLWPHCPEPWPLVTFWEAAGQANEIGRARYDRGVQRDRAAVAAIGGLFGRGVVIMQAIRIEAAASGLVADAMPG